MVLVFEYNNTIQIFIHIPKNSGKYIRNEIKEKKDVNILKCFWDVDHINKIDLAHMPYILFDKYLKDYNSEEIITYVRNPYHRIISAFIYKTNNRNPYEFRKFIKKNLIQYKFDSTYDFNIIHYYPQYLFLIDKNYNINIKNITIKKVEDLENSRKYNFKKYYNNKILSIINKIYKKDFEYFNYEIINTLPI
jgi:hypothetical protein